MSPDTRLWFGILGPLIVKHDGGFLDLGSRKRQLVLAALLCHANSQVSIDSLIDTLWEDKPPATARKNVHVYVSSLRSQFRAASSRPRIVRQPEGYLLQADEHELDALAFEQRVSAVRARGSRRPADVIAAELGDAISLWRGRLLEGLCDPPFVGSVVERLSARLVTVFEEWAEAEVRSGRAARVIERVADVAQEHPFRERLRMIEMSALARLGRRSEALAIYDNLRQALARDLGLSPGSAISSCYQSLLADHDPEPDMRAWGADRVVTLLPPGCPSFTGRDDCVREVLRAIGEQGERLVVLHGPVGVGKTALAVACAHRLRGQFPDGQVFVRVRHGHGSDTPPSALMQVLAASRWPAGGDDRWTQWQHWLAGHRALVVLDGGADQPGFRRYLPEAGDSAVVVTSRARLSGLAGACHLTVPPFTPAEAVELLGHVIGCWRVAGDPEAAGQLVAAVGHLPLGVRAIGDKLAGLRHLPLREYLTRLSRSPDLTAELAVSHSELMERLDEAVDDLADPLRFAYLRLAVHPLPIFTLAEAAELLGADGEETIRILEHLVEAGALKAPESETTAHAVVYEIPPLMYVRARERAAGPVTSSTMSAARWAPPAVASLRPSS